MLVLIANVKNIYIIYRWLAMGEEDTMYLDIENPVMRYIIHNELRQRFPEVLTTDSLGNSYKVIY